MSNLFNFFTKPFILVANFTRHLLLLLVFLVILYFIFGGQTITISRPINMDDTVTLETYYGTVLLNNQSSLSGFLTEYDWFQCPPGETCTGQFNLPE